MKALYSTQWNRKRAAALLGVDYKALLYKMKKLGIDIDSRHPVRDPYYVRALQTSREN